MRFVLICIDRKSTRLNSSHLVISYAVFCLKKKNKKDGCKGMVGMVEMRQYSCPACRLSTVGPLLHDPDRRGLPYFRFLFFFFFNDTATTEIYTLSLHDALPICMNMLLHGVENPDIRYRDS